jgi:hypothetical protein
MYYGIVVALSSFMSLINSKVIDPSLHVGGGYFFGDSSYGTLPGAGFDFLVHRAEVGLSLETSYKNLLEIEDANGTPVLHLIFNILLVLPSGGKDTDGDGIIR